MKIDVAVGEVPWERELLAALAASPDAEIGRRLVDLAGAKQGADTLITCPSVRGFTESTVASIAANRRVIVLLDSIRPPWLTEHPFDVRDIDDVEFTDLVARCAALEPTPRLQLVQQSARGRITAFVGVSGGVGVTTLAWMYAKQRKDALLIDCNIEQPAVALLVGNGARTSTLCSAIRELDRRGTVQLREHAEQRSKGAAVLGLSMQGDDEVSAHDIARVLVIAAEQFPEVVLDCGVLGERLLTEVLEHVDRLVVVTLATPLGLVRLCSQSAIWKPRPTTVVVNRIRASAAGSRHVATAMRNLVESEMGTVPFLVADHVLDCDRGWLAGDWGAMSGVLEELELPEIA